MTTIEEQYCNRCPQWNDCGFITRGLQRKCTQLSDFMDGYESGKSDGYRQALLDIRREINEKTAQGYKFPLLHIFSWIDIKLGLKTEDK